MSVYGVYKPANCPERALMDGAPDTVGQQLRWAHDGQTVWAFSRKDNLWVVAVVVCAAGDSVRVANEWMGFDTWTHVTQLSAFIEPAAPEHDELTNKGQPK